MCRLNSDFGCLLIDLDPFMKFSNLIIFVFDNGLHLSLKHLDEVGCFRAYLLSLDCVGVSQLCMVDLSLEAQGSSSFVEGSRLIAERLLHLSEFV